MANSMFTIIAAVNRHDVLEGNLLRSPLAGMSEVQFIPAEGFSCAGKAYNSGMQRAKGDILIFAHQDVYIPCGWEVKLVAAMDQLEKVDKRWGVLGVFGIAESGALAGRAWSTGLNYEVKGQLPLPSPVQSLDELLLVVNTRRGLRFDENLPAYHLYGTDIVQESLRMGLGAYAIDAPVIHNSLPLVGRLDISYVKAYRYMQRKWKNRLPLLTPCCALTQIGWPLIKARYLNFPKRLIRQRFSKHTRTDVERHSAPCRLARQLGYE